MHKGAILSIAVNVCRLLLALTFLLSGFLKANDPLGTVYKFEDYLAALGIHGAPQWCLLFTAIALATFEVTLGTHLLFGMHRRKTSVITFITMTLMTLITVYIYIFDPVSDCGCFGDAIILTNGQTLGKNIILLAAAAAALKWHRLQKRAVMRWMMWPMGMTAIVTTFIFSTSCVYHLPLIDFRPYSIGTNLRTAVQTGGSERPEFKVTLIYEKDGQKKEISIDDPEPDSTWTYTETRRELIKGSLNMPISSFSITDAQRDEDMTESLLEHNGYTFVVTLPIISEADEGCIGDINELCDYAGQNGDQFIVLTASEEEEQERWREDTGALYRFYKTDERELKTMVRANPGLILLHDGVIIRKWSNWQLPEPEEIESIKQHTLTN